MKVALALVSLLLSLAAGEILVRRWGGRRPLHATTLQGPSVTSVTGYFWVPDEDLGFRNRPNGRFLNDAVLEQPIVTTDAEGRRGGPSSGEPPRIVLVGDSVVFAAEVGDDSTPASETWRALGARPDEVVGTVAVRGYNTVQARRALEKELDRIGSVDFVIHFVVDNDYVENLNPVVYFPAMARTARPTGSTSVPFEDARPDERMDLWRRSLGWYRERDGILGKAPGLPARAIYRIRRASALANSLWQFWFPRHEGTGGPERASCEEGWIGPVWVGAPEWQQQVDIATRLGAERALAWELRGMDDVVRRHGGHLLVTEFTRGENRSNRPTRVEKLVLENGLDFVSLEDAFPGAPEAYMARTPIGLDGHYGRAGTRAVGQALAKALSGRMRLRDGRRNGILGAR